MRKTLRGLLIPVLLASLALSAAARDKLTLGECVDLALRNSPSLRIADEAVTGASLKVDEAKSQLFPQVSLAGSYTRMTLVQQLQMSFMGQTFNMKFGLADNYSFSASAAEPLFAWGRVRKSIELSRTGVELARSGWDMARQAVTYQVAPLFYGVLFFREAIQVLDDAIAAFDKKADIMARRYEAGLASSFDASAIRVQVSALKAQRLDFENNIRKLAIAFNTLAGRNADEPFDPEGAFEFSPLPREREALVASALAQRIEFDQIGHQARMAELGVEIAKAAGRPSLVLALNYNFRNGYMPNINRITGNFMATLSLNYPVFDGFRTSAQAAEGQSALRSLALQRQALEQAIRMEIDTALADLSTLEQKIDIEKVKIRQAEDALKIAEDRYHQGLLSAQDFIDSQNNLESARLNYLQLVYSHILGTYHLYRSTGKRLVE